MRDFSESKPLASSLVIPADELKGGLTCLCSRVSMPGYFMSGTLQIGIVEPNRAVHPSGYAKLQTVHRCNRDERKDAADITSHTRLQYPPSRVNAWIAPTGH